jgi:hypothetical protein
MDSFPARALLSALTAGTSSLEAPPELAANFRMKTDSCVCSIPYRSSSGDGSVHRIARRGGHSGCAHRALATARNLAGAFRNAKRRCGRLARKISRYRQKWPANFRADCVRVVQLARVPLGIGTIAPVSGSSSGRATSTIRGSGFKAGVTASIGGKSAVVTLVDINTPKIVTFALNPGKYGIAITNSDGEAASLDASFIAN